MISPPQHAYHAGHALPGRPGQGAGGHTTHHAHMVADFRRRFWVSLVLTVPVLALARHIQGWLGLHGALTFPGDSLVQFALASAIFVYGGWPFLIGLVGEIRKRRPGMMTLIGLAIAVAYGYSSAVVFGLRGEDFFWELGTLIGSDVVAERILCRRPFSCLGGRASAAVSVPHARVVLRASTL